jgi:hypothetical protein
MQGGHGQFDARVTPLPHHGHRRQYKTEPQLLSKKGASRLSDNAQETLLSPSGGDEGEGVPRRDALSPWRSRLSAFL